MTKKRGKIGVFYVEKRVLPYFCLSENRPEIVGLRHLRARARAIAGLCAFSQNEKVYQKRLRTREIELQVSFEKEFPRLIKRISLTP